MSAESLRKGVVTKLPGHSVRPQPVSEKTFMESVAGLINEVGLAPQVRRRVREYFDIECQVNYAAKGNVTMGLRHSCSSTCSKINY